MDEIVNEKLEQKHVHWAPETFENGIEKVKCEGIDEIVNEKLEQKHVHLAPEAFENGIEEVKCEGIDEVDSTKKEIKVEKDTTPSKVQNQVNLGNSKAKTQIGKPHTSEIRGLRSIKCSRDVTLSIQSQFICRLWKYDSFFCKCLDLRDIT